MLQGKLTPKTLRTVAAWNGSWKTMAEIATKAKVTPQAIQARLARADGLGLLTRALPYADGARKAYYRGLKDRR